MILRPEWHDDDILECQFYNAKETIANVKENFDIRRLYGAEGKDVTIRGRTEKCLVQTSSNPFTEYDDLRKVYCPIDMTIHRGDYVYYEDDTWLIKDNIIDVDGAYTSIRMNRCSFILKWQNESGDIIERPIFSLDASSYNNGQWNDGKTVIGNDQIMLWIPMDGETLKIGRGKEFFISNSKTSPTVYELTRPDSTTFVFSGHGCLNWLCTETQHTITEIELQTGVCGYKSAITPSENGNLFYRIVGDDELIIKTQNLYKAQIHDYAGNELLTEFSWKVESDCAGLNENIKNNELLLFTNDYNDIGSSVYISIVVDQVVKVTLKVQIGNFI